MAFDFGQHIVDAGEILAHAIEFALAHLAPSLEERKPGRLLYHPAQFGGLGLDDLLDAALFDQGVAAAMNLRGHEELGDVLQPARDFIDQVFRFARAIDPTRDADFAQYGIRLRKAGVVVGLEQQRDFGHPGRRI